MLETKMSLQSDIFDKQGLGHWFSIGIILYPKDFLEKLDSLIESAYKNRDDIKEKVAKIVTTYKIDKRD